MLTRERTDAEVTFLEKTLALQKGVKILDCPCGHGRHSIELARRGYDVTGQDLNGFFLEEAQRSAKQTDVPVRWIEGDMGEIPFDNEFDVALNLFTSFGYLEDDHQNQKFLNAVSKALKSGGTFVVDVINRDRVVRNYRSKHWLKLSDSSVVLHESEYDRIEGRTLRKEPDSC